MISQVGSIAWESMIAHMGGVSLGVLERILTLKKKENPQRNGIYQR
jgi:hypothetical protein